MYRSMYTKKKVPWHSLLPLLGEEVVKELDLLEGLAKVRKALQSGVVGNQNLRVGDGVLQEFLFLLVKVSLHGIKTRHIKKKKLGGHNSIIYLYRKMTKCSFSRKCLLGNSVAEGNPRLHILLLP